jgi:hypothetical protein
MAAERSGIFNPTHCNMQHKFKKCTSFFRTRKSNNAHGVEGLTVSQNMAASAEVSSDIWF